MENICINFRDVGEFINLLAEKVLMKEQRLFRGGKITEVENLHQIGAPKTIINLRCGKDPSFSDVRMLQIATDNRLEVYDTSHSKVQRWLNEVMMSLQCNQINTPVLIHCTSGEDRTGVAVAALLALLDIPHDIIIEEYLLSEGTINRHWIERALHGIADLKKYFNKVCTTTIKEKFLIKVQ